MASPLPAKADDLIPHRRGMKLIDRLTSHSPDDATASLTVQSDNLFLDKEHRLERVVLVELLAQTAAAHSGYTALSAAGPPMFGFLVGIKNFNVIRSAVEGEQLTLIIHRDFQMENVTFLTGKVLCETELLAEGVLKLWEMPTGEVEPATALEKGRQPLQSGVVFNKLQKTLLDSSMLNRELIQNCQRFEAVGGSNIEADFYFRDNFIGFEGHFPDNPIVPGVLLLKTGLLLAELGLQQKTKLKSIRTAKFAKTVLPDEDIYYSLTFTGNQVKVEVKNEQTLCAKFSFEFIKV